MKAIKIVAAALLSGFFFVPGLALAKDVSTTLSVTGWHCGGCSSKTEAAIKEVKGVKSAEADIDKKRVVVAYDDSQTSVAAIQAAVKKLGYSAGAAKGDAPKADAAKKEPK